MGHPLYFLLHDEPNSEMTSFVFRETLMTHLLLWGNAYAQIIASAKSACAHAFIKTLPSGYDIVYGGWGYQGSGKS